MDDGDRDADGYKLLPGDKALVSGMVDDDMFEATSIEAYSVSVFVGNINTTFYASPVDEDRVFLVARGSVIHGPAFAVVPAVGSNFGCIGLDRVGLFSQFIN